MAETRMSCRFDCDDEDEDRSVGSESVSDSGILISSASRPHREVAEMDGAASWAASFGPTRTSPLREVFWGPNYAKAIWRDTTTMSCLSECARKGLQTQLGLECVKQREFMSMFAVIVIVIISTKRVFI